MMLMIFSCSSLEIPMLSSACRVPQSGQISVVPSVLEMAGLSLYSFPHKGQVLISWLSVFMARSFLADFVCDIKVSEIESKNGISESAGVDVGLGRYSKFSVLVHDVHKGIDLSLGSIKLKLHFGLVVETRITLVGIKTLFVSLGNFPDCNGNDAAFFLFDGKVGACFAALVKELVIFDHTCADHLGSWASVSHLLNVQVRAVGNVVFFHLNLPFRRECPSTTLYQ